MDAKKILVVDDDAVMRKMVGVTLRNRGCAVTEAPTADEALKSLAAGIPDLLILDGMLPDTTGFEFGAALKADPRTRGIPILLMSAITSGLDGSDRFWKVSFTADDFISKPFKLEKLVGKAEALLRSRRSVAWA